MMISIFSIEKVGVNVFFSIEKVDFPLSSCYFGLNLVPYGCKPSSQNVGVSGKRITLPLYMLMFLQASAGSFAHSPLRIYEDMKRC